MNTIYKSITSHPIYLTLFNKAYNEYQTIDDSLKYGSRKHFSTDGFINGEYFRSRTNNQYFCVVGKNVKISDVNKHICDFRKLEDAIKIRNYNPETDVILRLEFSKNKKYFVESYQAISMLDDEKPDVTIMNVPIEELLLETPKFVPLPDV